MAPAAAVEQPLGVHNVGQRNLTEREAYEIEQYAKIVRFRDNVVRGIHPTIKPPNLDASASLLKPSLGSLGSGLAGDSSRAVISHSPNVLNPPRGALRQGELPTDTVAESSLVKPKQKSNGQAVVDPNLPNESEDNSTAELVLKRRRLERFIRGEAKHARSARQSPWGRYADLDVSEVLARALVLSPPSPEPQKFTADAVTGADADANADADADGASDSFDDKTFYTSQHDTIPSQSEEPQLSTAVPPPPDPSNARPNIAQPAQTQPTESARPAMVVEAPQVDHRQAVPPAPLDVGAPLASVVPGLNNYVGSGHVTVTIPSGSGVNSGIQSQSHSRAGDSAINLDTDAEAVQSQSRNQAPEEHHPHAHLPPRPQPPVAGHDRQPLDLPPAPISTSAFSEQSRAGPPSQAPSRVSGAPAQVVALRQNPSAATSSDSSSQAQRPPPKGKNKKKGKRKAERQGPEAEVEAAAQPYVKAEPRSPSPLAAPSYAPPAKRPRRGHQATRPQPEPMFETPSSAHAPDTAYMAQPYREGPVPFAYDTFVSYPPQRAVSTAMMGEQRFGREYLTEQAYPANRPLSNYAVANPAPPYDSFPSPLAYPRRTVSQVYAASDADREQLRPYSEYAAGGRASVHPSGNAYSVPREPPPSRVLVDAAGRELYEPSQPAMPMRRPIAPPVGPGGDGIVYERMPSTSAVPRQAGHDAWGMSPSVYGGAPAPYAMPRRIVTEPVEYSPYDYGSHGQNTEYQPRTVAPPRNMMEAPEGRRLHEAAATQRSYVPRAASMMPAESVRYEMPHGYAQMQNVRPGLAGPPEYAPIRREATQPFMTEYAARPMESYAPRQQARRADEIAFIERPHGTRQEIVYADDARREVYR